MVSASLPLGACGADAAGRSAIDERAWKKVALELAKATPGVLGWYRSLTPPLPLAWPPTPTPSREARWARYHYAWARDPEVADGVRVAAPWARELLARDGTVVAVEALPAAGRELGIQGIRPVFPPSGARDGAYEEQLFRSAFALERPPADGSREAGALRAFYRPWLERNGVVAGALRPSHQGFMAWVEAAPP